MLRTFHIAAFGTLLGGHVFDVEPARLVPFLVVAIVTGAGLMALELASTFAWLFMVKGAAVVLKLLLLAAVPLFWDHRVALLLTVVVVASFAAHLPSRVRHYSLIAGRVIEPHDRVSLARTAATARGSSEIGRHDGGNDPAPTSAAPAERFDRW